VARMAVTYRVDAMQAERVTYIAKNLFKQIATNWDEATFEGLERKLGWATQLHEIGSHISHSDYHKHGAYILENVDAVGFAQHELHRLGLLVLGHKGKLKKIGEYISEEAFACQLISLRLAVIACHARAQPDWSSVRLKLKSSRFELQVPTYWTKKHPQSIHLLQQETSSWQKLPWTFDLLLSD
jgi:exopolyphosphatase / guanosine-5'-triphosphate,3'-diphosphate pyrophosphatase